MKLYAACDQHLGPWEYFGNAPSPRMVWGNSRISNCQATCKEQPAREKGSDGGSTTEPMIRRYTTM